MAYLNSNLRSFSLLETMVAFVLILICTTIAGAVFIQVQQSGKVWQKAIIETELDRIIADTETKKKFIDEQYQLNSLTFEKRIKEINGLNELVLVEIKVKNEEGIEQARRKLLLNTD